MLCNGKRTWFRQLYETEGRVLHCFNYHMSHCLELVLAKGLLLLKQVGALHWQKHLEEDTCLLAGGSRILWLSPSAASQRAYTSSIKIWSFWHQLIFSSSYLSEIPPCLFFAKIVHSTSWIRIRMKIETVFRWITEATLVRSPTAQVVPSNRHTWKLFLKQS